MIGIRRITRYVFREQLGPTVLGFSLYTFILLMNAFFLVAQKAVASNLGWDLTFRMFLLKVPSLLVLTIPMAILLGALIGIGRLSADSEWIAIQGSGHGLRTLVKPSVILGLIGTAICSYLFWVVVPRSNIALRATQMEVMLVSNMAADLKPRTFYFTPDGQVIFVDEIVPGSGGLLQGVFLHSPIHPDQTRELILAREGNLYPSSDGSGSLLLDLRDVALHLYKPHSPDSYQYSTFETFHKRLPPPAHIEALKQPPRKTVRNMGLAELRQELSLASQSSNQVIAEVRERNALLELNTRFALPLACLLFAILAVPLGVTRARSGKGAGFAMSMLVITVYYLILTICQDQARRGRIPPLPAIWSANTVILVWCLYALWKLRRPGGDSRGFLTAVMELAGALWRRMVAFLSPAAGQAHRQEENLMESEAPEVQEAIRKQVGFRIVSRLDLYIGTRFFQFFIYALLSSYLIYGIVELKSLITQMMEHQQPPGLLLSYFKYFAPGMIPFTVPIACMVGAIVAVTLLSRTGELNAIKACGISVQRATAPILVVTLAICGIYYIAQDKLIPVTSQKSMEIKDQIQGRSPRTYGARPGGSWVFSADGSRLYHYRLFDNAPGFFQALNTFTIDRDTMRVRSHRFGDSVNWQNGAWVHNRGWYRTFPEDGTASVYLREETTVVKDLDGPEHFAQRETGMGRTQDSRVEQFDMEALKAEILSLHQSGYDTTSLDVAYYGRLARPLTPLVMVVLGLPFAFRIGRKGSLYGIGVAILLVILYWATFAIFNALGLETILPPFLAAWAPNIFYGLLGGTMMLYVRT